MLTEKYIVRFYDFRDAQHFMNNMDKNTYANDYRDLSALKRIADAHCIAILLIHHLRKETADDVFSRISGTTAISGAVDSSFTLVEDKRGSGKAKLSCKRHKRWYQVVKLSYPYYCISLNTPEPF